MPDANDYRVESRNLQSHKKTQEYVKNTFKMTAPE